MDLSEFKAKVRKPPSVNVCTPSSCGGPVLPNDEEDEKEEVVVTEVDEDDEEEFDMFYSLNLLSEAQDMLESVLALDRQVNVLRLHQWQDIKALIKNIDEFTSQFESFGSE